MHFLLFGEAKFSLLHFFQLVHNEERDLTGLVHKKANPNLLQVYLKGRSVQEGNTATFFTYSKIQTTSFGRPIETYVFLLNGLISCLKTLRGETDRAIVTTITAAPGGGAAPAPTIPTAETENQRGKRVAAKTRGGTARGGPGAERGGGPTAGAGRGEAAAAAGAAAGVTVGHAAGAGAGAPLDPGAGVKRDQAAEEKIVKLPKQSEIYFQKSLIDKNRAEKEIFPIGYQIYMDFK